MQFPLEQSAADIIVCVHNSHDDVKLCLESVIPTLNRGDRLIIVDDGSSKETKDLCEYIHKENPENTYLLRRENGSGFCKAANAGLKISDKETVILLNSDTIVSGTWIEKLLKSLHRHPRIGISGPLSNSGGWQSIPNLPGQSTPPQTSKSDAKSLVDINKFCEDLADRLPAPIVEQVNGFCLAIKREVINCVGYFDEECFPMGYGEESDLNLRAQNAGFLCTVALDCFVFHAKTKSYTSDKRKELSVKGRIHLDRLHGQKRIKNAVKGSVENPILIEVRRLAEQAFKEKNWLVSL